MDILFYHPLFDAKEWQSKLKEKLPDAKFHFYEKGKHPPADYALVWRPRDDMLAERDNLKAIFALGAGVDAILDKLRANPTLFPQHVPLYRLQDAGMVKQMQEYTLAAVMRYFRRLDQYQQSQQQALWTYLSPYNYDEFEIGIMGLGVLGSAVATQFAQLGFKVKGWSLSQKHIPQVKCYSNSQLAQFLHGTKLLINLLPSTLQTHGILNNELFSQLKAGAYLINIARGDHLVETDLLNALQSKQLQAATLDVFIKEPLPKEHPFWKHPEITITPHISAITHVDDAVTQIATKIKSLEKGIPVKEGLVDLNKGY